MNHEDIKIQKVDFEDVKIIDLSFEEVEIDGQWKAIEKDQISNLSEMVGLKQPIYIRLLCVVAFVISLFCNLALLAVMVGFAVLAGARLLTRDKNWSSSIVRWWKFYCRCLACNLISFVGIFNIQFALTILSVYFTLFDSSSYIMTKFSNR